MADAQDFPGDLHWYDLPDDDPDLVDQAAFDDELDTRLDPDPAPTGRRFSIWRTT
ncbi:MAG TPA: hypothetical protein VFV66_37835 [Nonomuraea sp.]|nr:hypothetical protein [Nonomuraea sp.]